MERTPIETPRNGAELTKAPEIAPRRYCDTCVHSQMLLSGGGMQMICRNAGPQVIGGVVVVTEGGQQVAKFLSQVLWATVNREDWCPAHTPDPRGARTLAPANDSVIKPA